MAKQTTSVKLRWTTPEDDILSAKMADCRLPTGEVDWHTIACALRGRSAKQCRERWTGSLNPDLNRSPWSDAEVTRMFQLVEKHGTSWKVVCVELGTNRSELMIRNLWYARQRKDQKAKAGAGGGGGAKAPKGGKAQASGSGEGGGEGLGDGGGEDAGQSDMQVDAPPLGRRPSAGSRRASSGGKGRKRKAVASEEDGAGEDAGRGGGGEADLGPDGRPLLLASLGLTGGAAGSEARGRRLKLTGSANVGVPGVVAGTTAGLISLDSIQVVGGLGGMGQPLADLLSSSGGGSGSDGPPGLLDTIGVVGLGGGAGTHHASQGGALATEAPPREVRGGGESKRKRARKASTPSPGTGLGKPGKDGLAVPDGGEVGAWSSSLSGLLGNTLQGSPGVPGPVGLTESPVTAGVVESTPSGGQVLGHPPVAVGVSASRRSASSSSPGLPGASVPAEVPSMPGASNLLPQITGMGVKSSPVSPPHGTSSHLSPPSGPGPGPAGGHHAVTGMRAAIGLTPLPGYTKPLAAASALPLALSGGLGSAFGGRGDDDDDEEEETAGQAYVGEGDDSGLSLLKTMKSAPPSAKGGSAKGHAARAAAGAAPPKPAATTTAPPSVHGPA